MVESLLEGKAPRKPEPEMRSKVRSRRGLLGGIFCRRHHFQILITKAGKRPAVQEKVAESRG